MKNILVSITGFFEQLPDFLRAHRIPVWIGIVSIVVFLAAGLPPRLDMTMESWFESDDPVVKAFMNYREAFGSDDTVYIVYKAKDGDIFSEKSLATLAAVHEELNAATIDATEDDTSMLSHILEIKSLINVSYMEVDGDSLVSRDFVGEELPKTEATRELRRKEALNHKDYPLFYLSENSQYGGIYIRTDLGSIAEDEGELFEESGFTDSEDEDFGGSPTEEDSAENRKTEMGEYAKFYDEINAILEKTEYTDVLDFYPVGNPVIMKFFYYVLTTEISYILAATLVLILITLFYLFRSFSAVFWPVLVVILSLVCTLGLVSWLGLTMNMMVQLLVMIVLVIGVADSIHIMSGYVYFRKKQYDHRSALRAVLKKSGFACMLTSLTTSAGLLAMSFVPIPPIVVFGYSAAMGVTIAFLFSVILLPLLLDIWHPISKEQAKRIAADQEKTPFVQKLLSKIEGASFQFHKTILFVFFIIGVVAIYGLTRVKVNSNMVELIEESHPIHIAHILVDEVMGGTQNLEIYLNLGQEDALKDPSVLNAMEALQNYLLQEHPKYVVRAESLVNVVKNTYQVLNEDREEMYVIPQQRDTLSQTLFLFDNANREDRQLLVTDDYSTAHIAIRLKNYGSMEYLEFFDDVQKKTNEIFDPLKQSYPQMEMKVTGSMALMMKLIDYMSWSQIQSFGLALIVITLMLLFVFGSPKVGLIGMIPNLFPVMITFGSMGFFNIPLDADTLIIAPIVIGIAVDDTIHFLTHFRTGMLETGKVYDSITKSVREVGQAISFTTIILVLGFSTQLVSVHKGIAHFGFLTAIAFSSAWLADLFLLPALCRFMKDKSTVTSPVKTAGAV